MQYIFKLSGESLGMATAEVQALFEIFNFDFKFLKGKNNFVSVKSDATEKLILELCERSAFIKKAYFNGRKIWEVHKGRFLDREPMKKPAFHPTTLKPKLARALANLARAKKGKLLLDSFCGTGSILIEAAILGVKVVGIDFDEKMLYLAKKNLDFYKKKYKYRNYKLINGDATQLEKIFSKNSIDAIATDLPYGRSSRASLKNLEDLYKQFLLSAYEVLKNKKYLAFFYPNHINAKKLINKRNWKLISEGELYVHGGLTRKLLVLQKR